MSDDTIKVICLAVINAIVVLVTAYFALKKRSRACYGVKEITGPNSGAGIAI